MDSVVIGDNPTETGLGCLMTTWHTEESLNDALDFLLTCTVPDDDYAPNGCNSALIICIASDSWTSEIEQCVAARIVPMPN